jgi:hypothetical protein
MLAEFVKSLVDLSEKSVRAQLLSIPGVRNKAMLERADGSISEFDYPAPPRQHAVARLSDLVTACETYAPLGAPKEAMSFWITDGSILLLLDDGDYRENTVTLPLVRSEEMAALVELGGVPGQSGPVLVSQTKLVELLRFVWKDKWMCGCNLPAALARVEWGTAMRATGEASRGKESLGRSIEAELANTDKLPDVVELRIPLYSTDGLRAPQSILCSLEPVPAQESFLFRPFPLQVRTATEALFDSVRSVLDDTLAQVFFGTPEPKAAKEKK